jgi:hypothetical protein
LSLLPSAEDYDGVELTDSGSLHSDSGSITLLGYEVAFDQGAFKFGIFNKQTKFSFPLPRYPHFGGGLSTKNYVGMIVGALVRAYRLCSMKVYLENALYDLAEIFRMREYPKTLIEKGIDIFVRRHCHQIHAREIKSFCLCALTGGDFVELSKPLLPQIRAEEDEALMSFHTLDSVLSAASAPPPASAQPQPSYEAPSTSSQGLLNFFPSVSLSDRLPRRSSLRDSLVSMDNDD